MLKMKARSSSNRSLGASRPQTFANQIIKQIVKVVLPSDVVQLQSGRKPKKAKKGVKKGAKKAKGDGGQQPKAPGGFLSQTFGAPPPPPAPPAYPSVFGTNQSSFQQPPAFQPPQSTPFEKMFLEKLSQFKGDTPKGTAAVSAPSALTPTVGSSSLSDIRSRSRSLMTETGAILARAREARSRSQAGEMIAEEIPMSPPIRSALRSAPNAAIQPSVDVSLDGKEEMVLRPQAPGSTFLVPTMLYSKAAQASSSAAGMFDDNEASEEAMSFVVEEDEEPREKARIMTRELSPQRVENPSSRMKVVMEKIKELAKEKPSSKGKGAKAKMDEWNSRNNPLLSEYNMLSKEVKKEELGAGGISQYFEVEED